MTGNPLQRHRQKIDRRHVAKAMLAQHRCRREDAWRALITQFRDSR